MSNQATVGDVLIVEHYEKELEQLRARIAELEPKNAELSAELSEAATNIMDWTLRCQDLEEKLAQATSAREQELETEVAKLREANRRLQVKAPALERDRLIARLTEEINQASAIISDLKIDLERSEIKLAEATASAPKKEAVNHPDHYAGPGVECIEMSRHMSGNLASAFEYICRADRKGNAIEDLRKAIWRLRDEYARLEYLGRDTCCSSPVGIERQVIVDWIGGLKGLAMNSIWLVAFEEWDFEFTLLGVDGRPIGRIASEPDWQAQVDRLAGDEQWPESIEVPDER